MSGVMDATFSSTSIPLPCASCHQLTSIAACYCEMEVCAACADAHLALCTYAKMRRFRTSPHRKDKSCLPS